MSPVETITTTCTRDCPNTCGLTAKVEDGKLTGLSGSTDHPLTRGHACVKASRYVGRVYSPERIVHPMLRNNGAWQRCSWDEALDLVAERIKLICDESGPEAILYYQGYGERTGLKLLNKYFFNLLGGVTTLRGSLCGGTGQASQNLDFGERISHDPLDHYNSRAMILWGRNPVSTNISLVPIARKIKENGGLVLVVDPCSTKTTAMADRHIAPKPGSDMFLALAATKLILERGREDRQFLAAHCVGADEFRKNVAQLDVDDLCEKAGVTREDAVYLADVMTEYFPASILLGWGMHRYRDAHASIRAIDALAACAGTIGVSGGGVSQGFEEYGPYDQQYWGDDLAPERRTLLMPIIGEELLNAKNPGIRMIFSTASNPVCMAPNSDKVARAFEKTEFVIYSGQFLDDTADHADVFLPATTFLEEDDVMASYGHNYVGPVNKVIEPVGECRSDFHLFAGLAKRFDFSDRFCRDAEAWLSDICSPIRNAGCSMEELKKGPFRMPAPMVPYQERGFPTPSGRFQLLTSFDLQPDPGGGEYPYFLLTIASHYFICSERTMAEHEPFPEIRLHPAEAERCGATDGMTVSLVSRQGMVQVKLRCDATIRRDCIVAERGGWIKAGHGLNRLTADIPSTVGQGTPYYDTRVKIVVDGEQEGD